VIVTRYFSRADSNILKTFTIYHSRRFLFSSLLPPLSSTRPAPPNPTNKHKNDFCKISKQGPTSGRKINGFLYDVIVFIHAAAAAAAANNL
jgi:hypothetical protein